MENATADNIKQSMPTKPFLKRHPWIIPVVIALVVSILAIILVITTLLVFAGIHIYSAVTWEAEYTATAVVWASPTNSANSSGVTSTSDISIGTQLIDDFKQLLVADGFLQKVLEAEEMDDQMSTSELKEMISISHMEGTRVMYVSVTAASATRAAELANTIVYLFCDEINERAAGAINPTTGEAQKLIVVWKKASVPTQPSNPIRLFPFFR